MKNNRDKPIYPLQSNGYPSHEKVIENGYLIGLTKREYFASMAMQGLISNSHDAAPRSFDDICERALKFADELLNQLEKTK